MGHKVLLKAFYEWVDYLNHVALLPELLIIKTSIFRIKLILFVNYVPIYSVMIMLTAKLT